MKLPKRFPIKLSLVSLLVLLTAAGTAGAADAAFKPSEVHTVVAQHQYETQPLERIPGLLSDVNAYRATQHLAALKLNTQLDTSSQAKAQDLVTRHYWSHTTPDGKAPWTFITAAGYDYQRAGENLAKCFDSPQAIVDAWIASPEHNAVLVGDYKDVGFGAVTDANGCQYVAAQFGAQS
ncbi:hypothetical protein B5P43_18375 [Bacillus sp. SRB_336]|nr:hypothetical protein B5P43_18375 [Bacillus sp. SRB_336]